MAAFFGIILTIFAQTLDHKEPKWQLDNSPIGSTPVLEFRPMAPKYYGKSNLIRYDPKDRENATYWINELDQFLRAYTETERSSNVQRCDFSDRPNGDTVCDFQITPDFAPCIKKYDYGYTSDEGGPCVFLKLDKIFGWTPDYYNSTNLPPTMPEHLKERILREERFGRHRVVWVDCHDRNSFNIGPISYHPIVGFNQKYFPYTNAKDYISPLVGVHFEKPKRGVLIGIECKLWARNIHHDPINGRGSVQFDLFVEKD